MWWHVENRQTGDKRESKKINEEIYWGILILRKRQAKTLIWTKILEGKGCFLEHLSKH